MVLSEASSRTWDPKTWWKSGLKRQKLSNQGVNCADGHIEKSCLSRHIMTQKESRSFMNVHEFPASTDVWTCSKGEVSWIYYSQCWEGFKDATFVTEITGRISPQVTKSQRVQGSAKDSCTPRAKVPMQLDGLTSPMSVPRGPYCVQPNGPLNHTSEGKSDVPILSHWYILRFLAFQWQRVFQIAPRKPTLSAKKRRLISWVAGSKTFVLQP